MYLCTFIDRLSGNESLRDNEALPEISNATDYRHVIENLKRRLGLTRIHLCEKAVYLTDSVKAWLEHGWRSMSSVVNKHPAWYNGLGPTQAYDQHRKGGYT